MKLTTQDKKELVDIFLWRGVYPLALSLAVVAVIYAVVGAIL